MFQIQSWVLNHNEKGERDIYAILTDYQKKSSFSAFIFNTAVDSLVLDELPYIGKFACE